MSKSEAEETMLALIELYCYGKYFNHAVNAAEDAQRKFGNDPIYSFFQAYGSIMQDQTQEASVELDSLRDSQDVSLCTVIALAYAERKKTNPDREVVRALNAKIKHDRKSASPKSLYYAGLFLWLYGRNDKAKEYVEKMIKLSNGSREGILLKAWIDVTSGKDDYARKAGTYFDEALKEKADVFALMGKAQYHEYLQNYSGALEMVNQVIKSSPGFVPALIKKMKLLLSLQDWDQAIKVARRLLEKDRNNLEAVLMLALHSLCKDGDITESVKRLSTLIKNLDYLEPHNPELIYRMSLAFTRVCGRNEKVIEQTFRMVERAFSVDSRDSYLATELGYQMVLRGSIKEAMKWYNIAMALDKTSVSALTGIIHCQLIEGHLEAAKQQLAFLAENQQSIEKSGELLYLRALLAVKTCRPQEEVTNLLDEAVDKHLSNLQGVPLGVEYLEKLNPDFLLEIVKVYLALCPAKPPAQGQTLAPQLQQCDKLLDTVVKIVPGLHQGVFLLAKVRYLAGDTDTAQRILHRCLEKCPSHAEAHLLMAQIHLLQGNFTLCSQSIEPCLNHKFEIREHLLYHLIMAKCQKKMGKLTEAIQTLQMAMSLPGVQTAGSLFKSKRKKIELSISDCVSVFLELAEALRLKGMTHEAVKVIQDALIEFSGTPEKPRVIIADADMALFRGDSEMALSMLRSICPKQPYYIQANEKMADIYLNHRNDPKLYTSCYKEMARKMPSCQTFILLGDAYMTIQEQEKAIQMYDLVLKKNPEYGGLVGKIGKALGETHNYVKAITYYEVVLKTKQQSFLRYDLAVLLLRVKKYKDCERVLREALDHQPMNEVKELNEYCQYLLLLANVQNKVDKNEEALLCLKRARDVQGKVLTRVQSEQPHTVPMQKQFAGEICAEIAQHYKRLGFYKTAVKFYKEALVYCETDCKVLLDLARLHLTLDEVDACQAQCCLILKNDQFNVDATMMMADTMLRKQDYEQAVSQCQKLVKGKPDNYQSLSCLIDVLRRAGKLEEVPRFLDMAEKKSSTTEFDPGLNYCKGLYLWYTGELNDALHHFNKARTDNDWGQHAMYNMAEIYLNPDYDPMGEQMVGNLDSEMKNSTKKQEVQLLAIRTARKLLKELKPKTPCGHLQLRILENYCLLATKKKANMEIALKDFMEIAKKEKDNVPALLAVATAHMMLKDHLRARNQLKPLAQMKWSLVDADEFEKSWLLLADIYIHSGRYDLARDLLKRCLKHNKSCSKAYEYLGYMMEKDGKFHDAAQNYELAWKYGIQTSPSIGYKLALNYLKAKRHDNAIHVCHKVLAAHPNYTKIREDILDKTDTSLRFKS
ncbi:tetratricopeptide repeat protein 21B-like [Pleuronectes platessa]|uniref:tetratricopeptide repeat protein 21B-like n=1 Tax=Pleuronectes platessa TaxID=8262 RepID=UPI00232A6FAA|nr:tetratricopeptide repeat protein 21B-like [Pleuronectes platessa]